MTCCFGFGLIVFGYLLFCGYFVCLHGTELLLLGFNFVWIDGALRV